MNKKRLIKMIMIVIKRMMDPYFQGAAAELAFFFILSLVPATIILGEFLGVFSVSMEALNKLLVEYVTPGMASTLADILSYKPSGTISFVFIAFAIWAASKAQFSMMRLTNYSFSGNPTGKGYFRERFRAVKTIIITVFTLGFSLLVLVYGEIIINIVTSYLTRYIHVPLNFNATWYVIRWPIAMALYFLMVSYNYYVLPADKVPYKKLLPGSILASFGMLLATWIYSYYAAIFARYDILYGSLASIVALMIWFYILGFILIIGIQVNIAWDITKSDETPR